MATDVIMPKMGESITEGTVLEWKKNIGDTIALDETLLEISTDKVDSEVPSPTAGVLTEILFNVNDIVKHHGEGDITLDAHMWIEHDGVIIDYDDEELKKSSLIAIDTETTSIDPHRAELVGISISNRENTGFYIPLKGLETKQLLEIDLVIEVLNPILANKYPNLEIGRYTNNAINWVENTFILYGILEIIFLIKSVKDQSKRYQIGLSSKE